MMRSQSLILFLVSLSVVSSWKNEEFRNCNQTPFCKRARARKPGSCSLSAHDVSISGGDLTAKLLSDANPNPLILTLSVYQDGILRLKIDEVDLPKKRFQVPDVLVPEFLSKKIYLQRLSTGSDPSPSSVVYLSDGYEAVLRHNPFEIFVREKGGDGDRVLSMNSHGLFDFEQLRTKNEDEDWEEKFRTHNAGGLRLKTDPPAYLRG